jgi:glycerophosphoryl diester phosphodiesterase
VQHPTTAYVAPVARWAFLDHPGPLAFAHRGGAGDWPENTMPAFEHAVGLGYRYLETDVHVTADGVLLAFHDDHLDRVTDRSGAIAALPWSEVAKARVDGREPIPRLTDLLEAFPDARINIDPKHDAAVEPLIAAIRATGALDRVCVGAFSDRRIDRVRKALGPTLCTGLGPVQTAKLAAAARRLPVSGFSAGAAQLPLRTGRVPVVSSRFVQAAHDRGIQVHVWTIDDAEVMRMLLDLGVDGIMTDRPTVLREVLVDRGAWVA